MSAKGKRKKREKKSVPEQVPASEVLAAASEVIEILERFPLGTPDRKRIIETVCKAGDLRVYMDIDD